MRRRTPAFALALTVALILASCSVDELGFDSPTATPRPAASIEIAGIPRDHLLHAPDAPPPADGWPLVIVLHGLGSDAAEIRSQSGFDEVAEREEVAVVYPEGLSRAWLDAGVGSVFGQRDIANQNIEYMNALIDTLDDEIGLDASRIYVTGLSNGGMFAFHTACELSDRVAAVGLVAAASISQSFTGCDPAEPVSYIAFHGTEDSIVPYEGGPIVQGIDALGEFQSAQEAANFWVDINGCNPGSTEVALQDDVATDASTATQETWEGCDEGTSVSLVTLIGAGHTWPGRPAASLTSGGTNLDIDATEMLWEFFAAHPKSD